MKTWYSTTYRKLFFDFHSPGASVGLAAAFDAECWADRLAQANAQAVSVFTKCGYGYSFYQKGSVRHRHPHLPAGLDMLEQQIASLHRRGMKAIGYYHTFNSEPIARDHPDWVERGADGQPRSTSICLLSPLLEEWMLPHVEEIVTLYDVDAMFFDGTYAHSVCACPACQRRFAPDTGGLAIPADKTDPNWARFVAWKVEQLKRVRADICAAIHKHRPGLPVSFNWVYTPRMPEVVPDESITLIADIFPDDQYFNGSFLSAYWATLDRPFDVMNSAFLQWWGDWGCKPAVAMQQELAPVIAYGGLSWIGYQMTQAFDVAPAVMGELGKTLAFIQEREPLLEGAARVPHAAILHSTDAMWTGDEVTFWSEERELALRGAHRMLAEAMIPHHIENEEGLLRRLDQYAVVLLPDQRRLSPELAGALTGWVERGGALIATALTGTLDDAHADTGRFALESLLGVRYAGRLDQTHAYIEVTDDRLKAGTLDMPHLAEAAFALAEPAAGDVQVLARLRRPYLRSDGMPLLRWSPVGEDSGYPAITLRRVGRGWAAYVAGDIGRAYQAKNQWNLKHILANLLKIVAPVPLVDVEASPWVQVVLARQGGRLLVHLVNPHGDRPADGNNRCAEFVQPVHDVKVRVRRDAKPARVTLEPGGESAAWTYAGGVVTVEVPAVEIHRVVAIE